MRQRVKYKIIHAGVFRSVEKTCDLVAEFVNSLEPQQLIAINSIAEGRMVVWYRDR